MGVMFIAPRANHPLVAFLEAKFAGDPEVVVIRDRRVGPRRMRQGLPPDERRRGDRRMRASGFVAYVAPLGTPPGPRP